MGFDDCALAYDEQLRRGVRLSGRSPEWFAEQRVAIVREYLEGSGRRPIDVLEFGCGVGNHVPILQSAFGGSRIVGIDISRQSLSVARERHGRADVRFCTPTEFDEPQSVDLIYVNGVFHHIPVAEHARWLEYFRRLLRPWGAAAIFDNNPFSLPARLVMRLIPFDRGAVMVNPYRFRSLMSRCGFETPRLQFHFIFPHALSMLRPLERRLRSWPLGAQFGLIAHPEE
jgi:SAM-dependent methyltransferase